LSLGWIGTRTTDRLRFELNVAEKALTKRDIDSARDTLERFEHQLDELRDEDPEESHSRFISSGAYSLLKFNVQYLLTELKGDKSRTDHREN
jgi:hypothetical protein